LEKLWKSAPDGRLCALEQLKVVAMRDVQVEMNGEANMAQIARCTSVAGEGAACFPGGGGGRGREGAGEGGPVGGSTPV
jgi:hypothetical protein